MMTSKKMEDYLNKKLLKDDLKKIKMEDDLKNKMEGEPIN